MEEILAEKRRGAVGSCIFTVVLGAFIIALSIAVLIIDADVSAIVSSVLLIPMGVAVIVISIFNYVRIKRTPDRITRNGNKVDLGNGLIVNLNQIVNVDYRESLSRYGSYRWGKLTVHLENQKIDYYYMANVQQARDRIMQLVWQSANG